MSFNILRSTQNLEAFKGFAAPQLIQLLQVEGGRYSVYLFLSRPKLGQLKRGEAENIDLDEDWFLLGSLTLW